MNTEKKKAIPYGISDYGMIRNSNYYYVDKTPYLEKIENSGRYLFFIRPRRFGKSLFLSMMHYYYDVHFKDRFDELFEGTWIHDHPTEERGRYLVFSLNFATVDPAPERLENSFLELVRKRAILFVIKNAKFFGNHPEYFIKEIEETRSPADIMTAVMSLCEMAGQQIYIIIDEYDNFANTVLTASGKQDYIELTHGDGFFRSFFNILKGGTGDVNSPIKRLFITGVSPVTMDDVTSGFNIGKNISLSSNVDKMLGFTEDDVSVMLDYYEPLEVLNNNRSQLDEMLTQWYGNYRFSNNQEAPVFNSDMILYFLDHCLQEGSMPENLIDRNVRIDYGKLRQLIVIDKGKDEPPTTNGNFSRLKEIIEKGSTSSKIADGFSLEEITQKYNFDSLLFYFGLLSISGRDESLYRLQIPNQTVKRLYFDYIENAYKETGVFSVDLSKYEVLINNMAFKGTWRPLLELITLRMKESLALRDLITGEKAVQTFLNVYLGLSDLFIVHPEKEMNKGFADLLLEPYRAKYPKLNHSFLLELKYVKAGMSPQDPKIQKLISQAEEQLQRYNLDTKYAKTIGKTQLVKLIIIFSGHEAVYVEECK